MSRFQSLTDWLLDFSDDLAERVRIQRAGLFVGVLWISTIAVPLVVGAIFEYLVQKVYASAGTETLADIIGPNWIIGPVLAFVWGGGLLLQRYFRHRARHEDRMYLGLKWFYEGIRFEPEADVRCTMWVPIDGADELKLTQVADYYPRWGNLTKSGFRRNKRSGRVLKVSRKVGDTEQAIGILGRSALDCKTSRVPKVYLEEIPSGKDFFEYMVENWNFTKRQAKRLTPDRRDYFCMTIMDSGRTHLLGILYCDARVPNAFTPRIGKEAQEYAPRFAEILTSRH